MKRKARNEPEEGSNKRKEVGNDNPLGGYDAFAQVLHVIKKAGRDCCRTQHIPAYICICIYITCIYVYMYIHILYVYVLCVAMCTVVVINGSS